jgi:hypothetical protein
MPGTVVGFWGTVIIGNSGAISSEIWPVRFPGAWVRQLLTMNDDAVVANAHRVPAMAYYGVKSRGAVALRMVGAPRAAAEGPGVSAPEFDSFGAARVALSSIVGTNVKTVHCRRAWE